MATGKTAGNGLLDGFSLDDGEDFFGIKSETTENIVEKIKAPTLKDDEDEEEEEDGVVSLEDGKVKKKKAKAKGKDDEEDEDEDFVFGGTEDDDEEKDKKTKVEKTKSTEKTKGKDTSAEIEETEEDEDDFFTNLATDLKEKGILSNVDIPKDKKLTEEEFFKIQDDELESRVAETFEALFEELGEEGSNYLKFIKDGGNPRTFLNQVSKRFSLDELDTENDAQVNKTLSHYFTIFEKTDEEDIPDKIKWLEDSGKKKAYATKYFKIIKDAEKEAEEELIKAQKIANDNKIQEVKDFNNSLKETVEKTESVGSFNINKKEHKEIVDYITKPTVKVGKNNFVPEFNAKLSKILRGKTDKDKQQLAIIAKILKEDFNLPDLVTSVETKVTSRAKSRISDRRNGIKNTSSGTGGKSLADSMT